MSLSKIKICPPKETVFRWAHTWRMMANFVLQIARNTTEIGEKKMFHMQNYSTSILVVEFLGKTAKYLYLYQE